MLARRTMIGWTTMPWALCAALVYQYQAPPMRAATVMQPMILLRLDLGSQFMGYPFARPSLLACYWLIRAILGESSRRSIKKRRHRRRFFITLAFCCNF